MSVYLHDTGHGCAATNTQRSWNQWLQCKGRASLPLTTAFARLALSIFLAQWRQRTPYHRPYFPSQERATTVFWEVFRKQRSVEEKGKFKSTSSKSRDWNCYRLKRQQVCTWLETTPRAVGIPQQCDKRWRDNCYSLGRTPVRGSRIHVPAACSWHVDRPQYVANVCPTLYMTRSIIGVMLIVRNFVALFAWLAKAEGTDSKSDCVSYWEKGLLGQNVTVHEKTRYTFMFWENWVSAELISWKREEQNTKKNRIALSLTDVILSPFGQSDFSIK